MECALYNGCVLKKIGDHPPQSIRNRFFDPACASTPKPQHIAQSPRGGGQVTNPTLQHPVFGTGSFLQSFARGTPGLHRPAFEQEVIVPVLRYGIQQTLPVRRSARKHHTARCRVATDEDLGNVKMKFGRQENGLTLADVENFGSLKHADAFQMVRLRLQTRSIAVKGFKKNS